MFFSRITEAEAMHRAASECIASHSEANSRHFLVLSTCRGRIHSRRPSTPGISKHLPPENASILKTLPEPWTQNPEPFMLSPRGPTPTSPKAPHFPNLRASRHLVVAKKAVPFGRVPASLRAQVHKQRHLQAAMRCVRL